MKKFLLSLIGFFILSLILVAPSLASKSNEVKVVPVDQTINSDYFGIAERVEINGTVNGDAYIVGGIVIVNGVINGDLLTAGGMVTISGEITGDVRVAGGNVLLSGADIGGSVTLGSGNANIDASTIIGGSIVAGAGNLQIFAPIARGATIGAGNLLIANSIGGDVKAATKDLSLTSNANIEGNLTYWSEDEASISEGAIVAGEIKHELPKDSQFGKADVDFAQNAGKAVAGIFVALKLIDIFWLTIFGILFVVFLPNFSKRTSDYASKKLGWSLLFGFLALILLPIFGVLLFITIIGIPLAFLLFFSFLIIFWIGKIFAIYALGRFAMRKLGKKDTTPWAYILGVVIYLLLSIIPIIGFITTAVVSLAGVGALLATKKQLYSELKKKNIL